MCIYIYILCVYIYIVLYQIGMCHPVEANIPQNRWLSSGSIHCGFHLGQCIMMDIIAYFG